MTYFSLGFFLLLFLTLIGYSILKKEKRYYVLLLSSIIFFLLVSGKLIVYCLITTLVTYLIGRKLNGRKSLLVFGILFNLAFLVVLKYTGFFLSSINSLGFNLPVPTILLPIGISFYTLQSIAYLVDIKRGMPAEKNFFKVLLYMIYFPLIFEGPITRFKEASLTLYNGDLKYENIRRGLLRISYGLIKKIVIADRLNLFIKTVFDSDTIYSGSIYFVAAIFYTIQLYMDFSGTIDVGLGVSEMFGVRLSENFKRPFFSKSISEFWMRWHISLGSFFKDYLYYPISLSKPIKKLRKKLKVSVGMYSAIITSGIALAIVWLFNGLWHGAGMNFIFFGIYHFILIFLANLFEPIFIKVFKMEHIRKNKYYSLFRIGRTFLFVVIGEMFFRATTLTKGFLMLKQIIFNFNLKDLNIFSLGLDAQDLFIMSITLGMIFTISLLQEKKISVRNYILKQNVVFRFASYYLIILYIIIFGAYGAGYIPLDPIYANF